MEQTGMVEVLSKSFYDFINSRDDLKVIQGDWTHSDYWVNGEGEKLAYMETSSYGAPPVYKLKEGLGGMPACNQNTINVVASLFKKKQQR